MYLSYLCNTILLDIVKGIHLDIRIEDERQDHSRRDKVICTSDL